MCGQHFLRFVTSAEAQVEVLPWGPHEWLSRAGFTEAQRLQVVRVTMPPGRGHQFHYHPAREEIIYILDGKGEQWVGKQKKILGAGETAFIPKKVVHGIYNSSQKPVTFLAILSPAEAKGPFLIDVYNDKPWKDLRKPFEYT